MLRPVFSAFLVLQLRFIKAQDAAATSQYIQVSFNSELGNVIGGQYNVNAECSAFVAKCYPTEEVCASTACRWCQGNYVVGMDTCCSAANPTACFGSYYPSTYNGDNGNNNAAASTAAAGTAALSSAASSVPAACSAINEAFSSCEAATSNFDNLANSLQAQCLCYTSRTWNPDGFDQGYSSCYAELSSDDPTDTSDLVAFSSNLGFCSAQGNVLSVEATMTGSMSGTMTSRTSAAAGQTMSAGSLPTGSSSVKSSNTESTTKASTASAASVQSPSSTASAASASTKSSTSKAAGNRTLGSFGYWVLGLSVGAGLIAVH